MRHVLVRRIDSWCCFSRLEQLAQPIGKCADSGDIDQQRQRKPDVADRFDLPTIGEFLNSMVS